MKWVKRVGLVISWLLAAMLTLATVAVFSLDRYDLESNYDHQDAVLFVPSGTPDIGLVFVDSFAYHVVNRVSDEGVTGEIDEDGDNYLATSDAFYTPIFGDEPVEFGFSTSPGSPSCPRILIWRGTYYIRSTPCEEHRVYG